MYLLVIFVAIIAIILAMLLFDATGPELSPAELESSANSGHSELVRSCNGSRTINNILFICNCR